jgi:starch phosphorylase
MIGTWQNMVAEFTLEVTPSLPSALSRLEELANDLWYSWNIPSRVLFERLDSDLWIRVGHNPKLFLRNIDQARLQKAAIDPLFLNAFHQVLSNYDAYCRNRERHDGSSLANDDLIAYFCAEYGFHESLPVYSGGLGILAGDHCKTASDLRLPFVAVGLFYHQGYFSQQIDIEGNQVVSHSANDPQHLPMALVLDESGQPLRVDVKIGQTQVFIKAWKMKVGHINLYLLDTNVAPNNQNDCAITDQLYGGDQHIRIKQEIVLGIGGVRLLRRLGISPTVWHINEGHAAFLILERLRELKAAKQSLDTAIEAIASSTVFTTHTPVPAGHDHFSPDLMMTYLGAYAHHELELSKEEFLSLGCLPNDSPDFNMTTLAIKGARHLNGVSKIHGGISSQICSKFWPEVTPSENPMRYVTNGVHVSSILARQWNDLFDESLGVEWCNYLCDASFWQRVEQIPDKDFWDVKQTVKSRMLMVMRDVLTAQHSRHQISEAHLQRMLRYIDPKNPNILTIGFARRFATYKRATLLLKNLDRLRAIITDSERPVVFLFAGKAHPADMPGQSLLKELYRLSGEGEFIGKLLIVQGYDLALSRRLVSGVDVWLNNPIYPLEASGTSGMKAAINAALNLSVLDGWWAEGYNGENGWAIKPSPHREDTHLRDYEDARSLYEVLQDEVIPLYYDRDKYGYSSGWIKKAKRSMVTILPRFNTVRMLNDYLQRFYRAASQQGKKLSIDNYAKAQELAHWKARIKATWAGVHIRRVVVPPSQQISHGEAITLQVAVRLNHLQPQDVAVELVLSRKIYHAEFLRGNQQEFQDLPNTVVYKFGSQQFLQESGEYLYTLTFKPEWCGGLQCRIRAYPYHELLSHQYEMGMMVWM